ncbi:MAG: hypothetical protein DI570_09905 [Phenylobacterium zucineum]|nr:MAG: hypothetical protein DI570_09905 [Phenylobacterium zucineum]
MSAVIFKKAPNRLGKLLSQPGGKRRDEAVRDSKAALDKLKPELLAEIDGALATLASAVAAARDDVAGRREVYVQARTIVGFAGLCEKEALGAVAFSLCDLCDHYIEAGAWNPTAVEAHLKTMIVFRTAPFSETSPEGEAVMAGLREIVRRAEEQVARAAS